MSDQKLLQQFRKRDPEAFKAVFKLWYRQLRAAAVEETGNAWMADDVVGEVFVKVTRIMPPGITTLVQLKVYTLNAVRNTARNLRVKQQIAHKHDAQYALTMPTHTEDAPLQDAVAYEYIDYYYQKVCHTIDSFPLQLQRIMKYRYYEGRSSREIATLLSLALSTVHNQLVKGKGLLLKRYRAFPCLPVHHTSENQTSTHHE